jgi:hypothetical protein
MAGKIPRGGQGLKEVKSTVTTMMAVVAAAATVGWCNKEWGGDNTPTTMIPLTMTNMTRTTTKKKGDGILLPPGDAAQDNWWRTAANGYGQWRLWSIGR